MKLEKINKAQKVLFDNIPSVTAPPPPPPGTSMGLSHNKESFEFDLPTLGGKPWENINSQSNSIQKQ